MPTVPLFQFTQMGAFKRSLYYKVKKSDENKAKGGASLTLDTE